MSSMATLRSVQVDVLLAFVLLLTSCDNHKSESHQVVKANETIIFDSKDTQGTAESSESGASTAVADFRIEQNPNNRWSYGWTETLGSPLHLYSGRKFDEWRGTETFYAGEDGTIGQNITHNYAGKDLAERDFIRRSGALDLAPGIHGEYSVVRWAAKTGGTLNISGYFRALGKNFISMDVSVLHNNHTVIPKDDEHRVLTFPNTQTFSLDLDHDGDFKAFAFAVIVNAGDTIDFCAGYGHQKTDAFGHVAFEAAINENGGR
jgi:hypothetical protein